MIRKFLLVIFISILSISVAACGNPTPTGSGSGSSKVSLEGSVIVDGSGTVYPLLANIAEEYMLNEQTNVSVEVGRSGTSAGFKKFVADETDLSNASRKIKDEEIAQLEGSGINYENDVLEIKIALDGLTVVINKGNTWAAEMTKEEILGMFVSKTYSSDDVVLWSDIRSEWPSEVINFYGPNENHGTYEFFHEVLLNKADLVTTANLQQEYSTLVDLVDNDVNAIAFFGFGYYAGNKDKLTAIKIDFGAGPVEPSLETIGEDKAYAPFTRPVFTYINLKHAKLNPQVLDFAKYIVSANGASRLAGVNGFAPLPDSIYDSYLETLNSLG